MCRIVCIECEPCSMEGSFVLQLGAGPFGMAKDPFELRICQESVPLMVCEAQRRRKSVLDESPFVN